MGAYSRQKSSDIPQEIETLISKKKFLFCLSVCICRLEIRNRSALTFIYGNYISTISYNSYHQFLIQIESVSCKSYSYLLFQKK